MMKLDNTCIGWMKEGKCCCGSNIEFCKLDGGGILVNCETKGVVHIPNMWSMTRACNNPLCEWSKIKPEVEAHNWSDNKRGWKFYETKDLKGVDSV